MIVLVSSLGYWINPEVVAARVGLSVVCVLTQVQFSASVVESLPSVAYLTWLDYYVFVRFARCVSHDLLCSYPTLSLCVTQQQAAFLVNTLSVPIFFMVKEEAKQEEGFGGAVR